MPERTTLTELTQIGVETTPGTAVAATKRLRSVGFALDPEFETQTFKPSGNKINSIVTPGKEWSGGSLEGVADYSEMIYPISMLLGAPTITTPGGGTNTRAHTWTIQPAAAQDPKTFTIERGSSVRAERAAYAALSELGITFNRDEITLDGTIIARAIEDNFTLSGGTTSVAQQPILPTQTSVYFDTTFAGIGVTKLLRVLEAGFNMGDRFNALWPLDAAQSSYVSLYEAEPSTEITLTQVADAAGMGHLTRARAGTVGYLRIESIGAVIEAALTYRLRIDAPVKVTDWGYGDEDGLKTAEWTFTLVDDSTFGSAGTIELRNTLTAL